MEWLGLEGMGGIGAVICLNRERPAASVGFPPCLSVQDLV
jgi:hypothetical protein